MGQILPKQKDKNEINYDFVIGLFSRQLRWIESQILILQILL
jgi:hypothetical protein